MDGRSSWFVSPGLGLANKYLKKSGETFLLFPRNFTLLPAAQSQCPRISFPISPPGRAPSWDRGAGVLTRPEASFPAPSLMSGVRFPGGKVSPLLSPSSLHQRGKQRRA